MAPLFSAGKVVLITGPTSGIGLGLLNRLIASAASHPQEKPKKIVLVARNAEKVAVVAKDVTAQGIECATYICDLGDGEGCLKTAAAIIAAEPELHCLVANGGIWEAESTKKMVTNVDGSSFECHYATNFVSTALLVSALTPLLEASGEAAGAPSRVVVVGSFFAGMIHDPRHCCDVDLKDMGVWESRSVNGLPCCPACFPSGVLGLTSWAVYAESKLLQQLWAKHYAEKVVAKSKIQVFVTDPGATKTSQPQLQMHDRKPCYTPMGCMNPMMVMCLYRNGHGGSYSMWRATTEPLVGVTAKFIAEGPFTCPCYCPLTPIGTQCDGMPGGGCHCTGKSAAVYERGLAIEKSLREKTGIQGPAPAAMAR